MGDFKHCSYCPAKDECSAKGCHQEQLWNEDNQAQQENEFQEQAQREEDQYYIDNPHEG